MSISIRYVRKKEAAMEVVNDAFLKVFSYLKNYDPKRSFKTWFRRILINTSIDHLKRNLKHQQHLDINELDLEIKQKSPDQELSHQDLIKLIQGLSPAYRSVFNLFVIDGYNHDEIAKLLGISSGTSKSNLAKARLRLREMLQQIESDEIVRLTR